MDIVERFIEKVLGEIIKYLVRKYITPDNIKYLIKLIIRKIREVVKETNTPIDDIVLEGLQRALSEIGIDTEKGERKDGDSEKT